MPIEEQVGYLDFLKTTTRAGRATALPAPGLFSQAFSGAAKARPQF